MFLNSMYVNHFFTYPINKDDNETGLWWIVHIPALPYLFKIILIGILYNYNIF